MSEERLVWLDDDTVLVGEAARQYQEAIDEAVRGLRLRQRLTGLNRRHRGAAMTIDANEVARRFGYHPPRSQGRVIVHERVRAEFQRTVAALIDVLPDDVAVDYEVRQLLAKLEEAQFWANAAVARASDPDAEVSAEEAAAGPPGASG